MGVEVEMTNERMIAGLRFRVDSDADGKIRLRVGEYGESDGRILVCEETSSRPFALAIVESDTGRVEGRGWGETAEEAMSVAIGGLLLAASPQMGSRFIAWIEREGEAARG